MNLIELHILQSFPVSCLNRDDLNSPKTAIFGGVQRARISSQCWKRQIRLACHDLDKGKFNGRRSRQFIAEITERLVKEHCDKAEALSLCISHYLGKLDPKNPGKVKTIAYYSADELDRFASVICKLDVDARDKLIAAVAQVDMASLAKDDGGDVDEADNPDEAGDAEETKPKKKEKGEKAEKKMSAKVFGKLVAGIIKPALKKEFKDTPMAKDAADIALFGRMVASDHSLTLEGAAMFSHALSTHKADNEIDFFTAVDDLNPADDSGSGHMGNTEFNASVYYRYVALNLDLLADKDHLACLSSVERKEIVAAFIDATLKTIPGARRNSMNASTLPCHVLGIYKEKGQPIQLVNAFEKPVRGGKDGLVAASIERLQQEHKNLKEIWGIAPKMEVTLRCSRQLDSTLNGPALPEFIQSLVAHVE